MVVLDCRDAHWAGGYDKEVLDAILVQSGLMIATLSMDKGKCD